MTSEQEWQAIIQAERDGLTKGFGRLPGGDNTEHRVFVYPDTHHPFEDKEWLRHLDALCDEFRPTHIVHIGDGVDVYSLSSFSKDPRRKETMKDEFESFTSWWASRRIANPHAEMHYIRGNHDVRWEKFLWSKAPELAELRELGYEKMIKVDEIGFTMHPPSGFKKWGIRFKHGDRVSKGAGKTAALEMEDHRCDGVSGHTHRFGKAQRTDKEGNTTTWWEIGHACDMGKADYVSSPDWQLGGLMIKIGPESEREYIPIEDSL